MSGSKPPLSVSFHNFWKGWVARDSFFFKALSDDYAVTIDRVGRDLQISSVFGSDGLPTPSSGRPLRVWWTGEAKDPQAQVFDLFFGFRPSMPLLDGRWFRFPLWVMDIDWWDESLPWHVSALTGERPKRSPSRFCNFIFSYDWAFRAEFMMRLEKVRPVHSHGGLLNNVGARPKGRLEKLAVMSDHQFSIAFENQIAPGYVTEKLLDALMSGSIPIYWGAAEAKTDFNPEAFIDATAFKTMDDLIAYVVRLADDPDAMQPFLAARPFKNDTIPYEHTPRFFLDRIAEALSGPPQPVLMDEMRNRWHSKVVGRGKALERQMRLYRDKLLGRV